MRLKRYAVTVTDNWTPIRYFWTERGARRFWKNYTEAVYVYWWTGARWRKVI